MPKREKSGMEQQSSAKEAMSTTVMYRPDGSIVQIGETVSKDLGEPVDKTAVATGEEFESDVLEDVGEAHGSNFGGE